MGGGYWIVGWGVFDSGVVECWFVAMCNVLFRLIVRDVRERGGDVRW